MVNSAHEHYIISAIVDLGKETCNALPIFYAFTGCGTVSCLFSKGKCRVWEAWHHSEQKDVLTNVFSELGNKPSRLSLDQINVLEKFVLEIYPVRKVEPIRSRRKLPPSWEAVIHHTTWSCYQAGYLWRESLDNFDQPDLKSWGWGKKVIVIMVLCENQHK